MKKTYKNRLPKNMEASSIYAKVVDGEIIVEVDMKEKFQPKVGDFVVSKTGLIFIFGEEMQTSSDERCAKGYVGVARESNKMYHGLTYSLENARFATPEEKSAFLEKLEKECHMRWNPETKELEDIRWKPKARECYFYADYDGKVKKAVNVTVCDAFRISANNCFKTEEAAKSYAEQMKEIFKNSKAE